VTLRWGSRPRTAARYPGILAAAVLAGVTALAVAGCAPAAAPASAASGDPHSLTLTEAEAAYSSYVTVSDTAAARGNQQLGQSDIAYEQWTVVHGQYTALATARTPVPRYRYGQPAFYVPALGAYPQWFMVAVPRTIMVSGHPGATVNVIMLFERRRPDQPWLLDGSAVLDQPLPAIARDKDGYAIDVRATDPDLLLPPDVVGATQAGVVDEGPANPAAAVIGSGPLTTGLYATQDAHSHAATALGLSYQWLLEGAAFPEFELRTADGGALVMYAMYLDTTTEHYGLVRGSPIPVPASFIPLLAAPTEIGYHAVYANWTFEYAAVDPPAAGRNAKVQIIGSGGGPTYGHANLGLRQPKPPAASWRRPGYGPRAAPPTAW
jgi:hypothetical protein